MRDSGRPDYGARRSRAAAALRTSSLDALVLSPGPDLAYLTGYRIFASERLTCLVLDREGAATLVLPALEAPRAAVSAPDVQTACWEETESPFAIVAPLLTGRGAVAIADQMWAGFTLRLQEALPGRRLVTASSVLRALRARKDPGEIAALRTAARAADAAYRALLERAVIGRAERAIARDLADALVREGHDEVLFTIVAAGAHGASPHHETGDALVRAGEPVVLDFGGTQGGYCSDITRTVSAGAPADPEVRRVHDIVRRAQDAGHAAARVGVTAESVDAAARRVIDDAGYGSFFIHRLGHGIGLEGHEHPYLVRGNDDRLAEGMAFSIEPGIYLPGRFGVRLEDIAIIAADGRSEPLNEADHALAVVR